MQLGAGGFSVSLAAGDLATADSDAERVQALSTMAFAMLMLAGVPRSRARPKADEFVKAGKKNTTPGRLQEAAEKGTKANTVSPKQRKLKPSDISCLKKCFPAGTLVESESGLRPIEQISEDERVWGRSEVTGRWSLAKVVECYERVHEGEVVTLTLSNGEEIQATGSHPFWVAQGEDLDERPVVGDLAPPEHSPLEGRWVECRDVRPGDQLASLHGEAVQVATTASRIAEITVHNLQIAELATYTVGAAGVWVHNASKKLCPKGTVRKPRNPAQRVGLSKARQIAGYADDDLASIALKHRKANKLGRKGNVAVVEYEVNGVTKIEAFDTVGKSRKHSEFVARGELPEGAKVKRLFTERQPCQLPIPNCDRMLARDFPDAEITYLVEWGDTKASRTSGNQALDGLLRNEGL